VLGLDGRGGAACFADYRQWDLWQSSRPPAVRLQANSRTKARVELSTSPPAKRKLSYLEAREYAALEQRIGEAEEILLAKRLAFENPAIASDAARLLSAQAEVSAAEKVVDALYARWAELEEKQQP